MTSSCDCLPELVNRRGEVLHINSCLLLFCFVFLWSGVHYYFFIIIFQRGTCAHWAYLTRLCMYVIMPFRLFTCAVLCNRYSTLLCVCAREISYTKLGRFNVLQQTKWEYHTTESEKSKYTMNYIHQNYLDNTDKWYQNIELKVYCSYRRKLILTIQCHFLLHHPIRFNNFQGG